jgi:threonine/homoserine efflux transporter RhtA
VEGSELVGSIVFEYGVIMSYVLAAALSLFSLLFLIGLIGSLVGTDKSGITFWTGGALVASVMWIVFVMTSRSISRMGRAEATALDGFLAALVDSPERPPAA